MFALGADVTGASCDATARMAFSSIPERVQKLSMTERSLKERTFGMTPMLAVAGDLPDGDNWAYEIKWDGVRTFARVDETGVSLTSRNGHDVSARYPELADIGDDLPRSVFPLLLDGEIVAFNESGSPDFGLLQSRMNLTSPPQIAAAERKLPVHFAIFDAPVIAGEKTISLPYDDRRKLLDKLDLAADSWSVPRNYDDGPKLLEEVLAKGMEGVAAKRRASLYEPGRRTGAWTKVKCKPRQEFVVGGWTSGTGARSDSFGALALGVHEPDASTLHYMGNVGSGFNESVLGELTRSLDRLERKTSPFAEAVQPNEMHFVKPQLVVEVEYQALTNDGHLRQPIFKGIRTDKPAKQVVFEGDPQRLKGTS
jgi:bifunctional non-homologous end joining protein LigD